MKRSLVVGLALLLLSATGCRGSSEPGKDDAVGAGMMRMFPDGTGLSLGVDDSWIIEYTAAVGQSPYPVAHAAFTEPTSHPPASRGYALDEHGSISCFLLDGVHTLPSAAELRTPNGKLAADVESATDVSTPVGPSRLFVLDPTAPVAQPEQVTYTDYLVVALGRRIVNVVLSGPTAQVVENLVKTTIPTLRRAS